MANFQTLSKILLEKPPFGKFPDTFLDPFLGSGQVAVIAKRMGRRYLGFEIVPEYYQLALLRLETDTYRVKAAVQSG